MRDIQGNDPSLTSFADLGSKKGAIIYLNFTLQSYYQRIQHEWIGTTVFERTQMLNRSSVLLSGSDWEGRIFRCKMTLNMSFTAIWGYSRLRRVCLPGKNKWHVSLFKTSIGLHLRVILTGIWKNIIYFMYVRSLLMPLKSTVTKSLYVEKVPWSRSRGGGRALSGYLLDHRQPLHYYCKLYNVYCVGQYILCCISYIEEYIIFEKYCIICKTIHTIDVSCKLHNAQWCLLWWILGLRTIMLMEME